MNYLDILIVNYNSTEVLFKCLESIFNTNRDIIIDETNLRKERRLKIINSIRYIDSLMPMKDNDDTNCI